MGILKRIISGPLIETLYDSSNITASKYDTSNKDLTIIFKNGGNYLYNGVEYLDYYNFENSESQGSVFNTSIRKKYTKFQKLDSVDVEKYINEMNSRGLSAKEEELIQIMRDFVAYHTDADKMDMDLLLKVEEVIKLVKETPKVI